MGSPYDSKQIPSSRRGRFKGLRADAAEVTVTQDPVVEHFNVIEDIHPGQIPGFVHYLSDVFFFSVLKKDSATVSTYHHQYITQLSK